MNNPRDIGTGLPEGFDIDFAAKDFLENPWPALSILQRHDPVFWSPRQNGWIVTRHEDVKAGLFMDDSLSADRIMAYYEKYGEAIREGFPNLFRYTPKWVATSDPPAHTRIRQLFTTAFHKRIVERERLYAREVVDGLLHKVDERGEFDFVEQIASVIPSRVVCHMLGIGEHLRLDVLKWAEEAMVGAFSLDVSPSMLSRMDAALGSMSEVIVEEIARVRREPGEDLLTALVQARYENDKLSDDELVAACQAIFIAGFDSTRHMLSYGLVELAAWPEACAYLTASEENAQKVVNELLRYISLSKGMLRIARHDFEWHGKAIKKGDMLFLMTGAANRDPAFWPNPETFDHLRDNTGTLAFSTGIHHCVGHLLAKMELAEFFSAAFSRFDVEILPGERGVKPSYAMRTMSRLPVRFRAKPQA